MKHKDRWSRLTMQQKADLIKLYVDNGYTNLNKIKEHYLGTPYKSTNDSDYDYYNAHTDNLPKEEGEHYSSRNPKTAQLLKGSNHPTRDLMLQGEKNAGYTVYKNIRTGKEYSVKSDLGDIYGYEKVNKYNEGGTTESNTKSKWKKAKEVAYDVLEFVDPTGISSYATSEGDLRQAIEGYKKGTASLGDVGIEVVGALPLIGKLGKGIKLAKGVDKLNYFVKAADRANSVAKRIDTIQEAIPGVKKVATAVQGKTGAITNHLANILDLSTDSRRYINYGIDAFNNFNTGKDIVDIFKSNPYNYPVSRNNYVEKQPILVRSENINIPNLRQGQIDTINTVYNHFIDRGLSPRNAAAIMGSIMQESSFNPYAIQGNGDNAKGLFQMHGERLKDYKKYLEENNLKDGMIPQLNYMVDLINGKRGDYYIEGLNSLNSRIDELQSKSKRTRYEDIELKEKLAYRERVYGERIKNNTLYPIADLTNALSNNDYDLNYITDLFTNTIERPGKPHYENRRAYAKAFLEHFYGIPENETNKYDDGGPVDNDLYYSNIDPVEVTTAKRKVY